MIILPDQNIPRAKFLMPVFDKEWRTPSLAQPKDHLGNENVTRFRIDAKSNDGVIIWRGWFDDRAEFDAFLWAIALGTLKQERSLWNLPTPSWQPWMGELLSYEFATVTFLSSPTGSNQTSWTVPNDWNSNNNYVETIGGGASGRSSTNGVGAGSGGGGAAYSKQTNVSLTKATTPTWQVGAAGPAPAQTAGASGISGGDTWFNGTTLAGSSVGAKGGTGSSTATGGAGGAAASGIGSTKYSGGKGGNWAGGDVAGGGAGGGGSAGPNGNGGAGGNVSGSYGGSGGGGNGGGTNGSSNSGNNGGAGGKNYLGSGSGAGAIYQGVAGQNGTNGGGGGGAGYGGASDTAGNGGAGTEWDSTHGSGGGGGGRGAVNAGSGNTYGKAGAYGGAGGGGGLFQVQQGGAGAQGLIVITYEPLITTGFNMPLLGM